MEPLKNLPIDRLQDFFGRNPKRTHSVLESQPSQLQDFKAKINFCQTQKIILKSPSYNFWKSSGLHHAARIQVHDLWKMFLGWCGESSQAMRQLWCPQVLHVRRVRQVAWWVVWSRERTNLHKAEIRQMEKSMVEQTFIPKPLIFRE